MDMLEFAVPALNFKAVLPQIVLAVTGLTVLLAGVFAHREKNVLPACIALLGTVIAGLAVISSGSSGPSFSGMLLNDNFARFISTIICIVTVLTILISMNYQKFFMDLNCGEYYALLLFAATGMMFMGSAGNLIMVFVALETMSVSIYALAAFHKDREKSIESALKYFLLGAFASGFLLYGFALIYGATGTMDILKIGRFLTVHPEVVHSRLLLGGVALLTAGLGFKVAMVPFHMWTPDVYDGAPTSVTAFMATGVKAAAFAVLLRVFYVGLGALQVDWIQIMWIIAALTMTLGNVVALTQTDIKRMLAYSSIAHAGYLLVGFVAGGTAAVTGMLFYLLAYAVMNLGAFGVIALLGKEGGEYTELSDFAGLGFKYPAMGLVMAVFMFSMAGIPPTAGFMGKFYIFSAAMKAGFIWLAIIGVINSVISIYYYLRIIVVMYFKEPERNITIQTPSAAIVLALIAAAAGVMLMGILPSSILDLAHKSILLPM